MKFSSDEYEIDKGYYKNLNHKLSVFTSKTKTKKTPHLTIVTTYGLKQNMYSGDIHSVVTMDNFF